MKRALVIFVSLILGTLFYLFVHQSQHGQDNNLTPEVPAVPSDWERTSSRNFSVMLPPGWEIAELQGFDSDVGAITGPDVELTYDYGWYSDPLFEESNEYYYVEYEDINGQRAKLVWPIRDQLNFMGVHFPELGEGNKFTLSGEVPKAERQTVFIIFRTIEFH